MPPVQPAEHFSRRYQGRARNEIRRILQNAGLVGADPPPGVLSLGGGLPNPELFPFKDIEATTQDGVRIKLTPKEVAYALQYGWSDGYPELVKAFSKMIVREHSPQVRTRSIVGNGSQEVISKALDMLVDPGDPVLVEQYCYSGTLSVLTALKAKNVAVECDAEGMCPVRLRSILASWPAGQKRPKVLYTVPTGQNPTGATMPEQRKRDIYKVAQDFGIIIIEDDPYYFLYFGKPGQQDRRPPRSFLSLDTDSRVLRMDSFSKVVSSGMRLGFLTAHPDFAEAIDNDFQCSKLTNAGPSQVLAARLLAHWGDAGWDKHVAAVKELYARRRDAFAAAAERHLTGLADWSCPEAGMFFWIRLRGIRDSQSLIEEEARNAKVVFIPGSAFLPIKPGVTNTLRASYSVIPVELIDEALRRLAGLLRRRTGQSGSAKL